MYDGLWTIEFGSTVNRFGRGVLIFVNGRLLGGDEGYYYSGHYEIDGTTLRGKVNINRFDVNCISVFGNIDHFSLTFSGEINHYHFSAAGVIPNNPQHQIRVVGNKKEEL